MPFYRLISHSQKRKRRLKVRTGANTLDRWKDLGMFILAPLVHLKRYYRTKNNKYSS